MFHWTIAKKDITCIFGTCCCPGIGPCMAYWQVWSQTGYQLLAACSWLSHACAIMHSRVNLLPPFPATYLEGGWDDDWRWRARGVSGPFV